MRLMQRATPAAKLTAGAFLPPLANFLHRKCSEGETCGAQRKTGLGTDASRALSNPASGLVDVTLGAPGAPLPEAVRAEMGARFQYDFSKVRIHTDDCAAASSASIDAAAYTVGNHVVFATGRYAPDKPEGRRLLAHELAHVVQQCQVPVARMQGWLIGQGNDRAEREADSVADAVSARTQVPSILQSSTGPAEVARQRRHASAHRSRREEPESTMPTREALKAVAHAEKLQSQRNPAIWFDSWGNDQRDNNRDGTIDDRGEQGLDDGTHYKRAYQANVCPLGILPTSACPTWTQSTVDVSYKVCIDIPIESYQAAGVRMPTTRRIPSFFGALRHKPGWRVWDHGHRPSTLLDGDIVAARNERHQHAGIVSTGRIFDGIINLPGPTSSRHYGVFRPSGLNDIVSVPRALFESFLGIDLFARPTR